MDSRIYILIAIICFACAFYGPIKVLVKRQKLYKNSKELTARGDADGTAHLGLCYELGYGVKKDQEKAKGYYRKAAKMGSVLAQGKLRDRGPGKKPPTRKLKLKSDLEDKQQKMVDDLLNPSRKD